ncbi:cobalt-zinc-cadmium resistance protein [Rugosibacter aromaticivorans]|uniref:Cobalt-zinc-cadmium resistance protein n=1 Tax=Rugosibacter aromaticivorans TaxID=1565605 RepID=A0A0C5JA15_9PROT|nr:TolC family protein [Rugosibacter aromaticivorans]AJP48583.1 cobalt-zinc-cadmium resistance protein [Rugosibacter aromaticivorans]TBR12622.1 MAG: TolC family protein [Rugosibacter sp.]
MRKYFLLPFLAAVLFQPLFALSAELGSSGLVEPGGPLSLDTALSLTLQANAEVSAAARELEAVEATVTQAGVLPNPELQTLAEDRRRESRTTTVQINQRISLSGKRSARVRAAERSRDIAGSDLSATRADIRAGLIAAFFDVLIAQERLRLAQASADLAKRGTSAAAKRVAAGKVSPVEETKARVAEAGVKIELAQASSELRLMRQRLTAYWGNPSPRFDAAVGEANSLPDAGNLDDVVQRLDTTPEMRRASLEVERRRALTDVERSSRIPDVTVSLGAKRDELLGRNLAIVGLSIPIPLFDRNQGNLGEAISRQDKARDELAATRVRVQGEAMQAWQQLDMARSEALVLESEVLPGAQSALDAATTGFEYGKFAFLDVLDAQRTLFQARAQYLRALSSVHRARAQLDSILGTGTNNIAEQK